jgi:putative metalloenzyme radical SAM/SPASM domain maturase
MSKNKQQMRGAPPALRPFPSRLQVEVTTRCNMRCAMCVKSAQGSEIPEASMDLETFQRLAPAFAHCEALVLNGIGEPLLHPQLPEMASFARQWLPDSAWMGFQTNGLLLTSELAGRLVAAGVDRICVSVDALTPGDGPGELHGQDKAQRLAQAFAMLRRAGERASRPLRLGVEFVLMAENVRQLPAVTRWAGEQGARFLIVSHMLVYDAGMQAQALFNANTPKATAIFNAWKARAQEEGLDLRAYLGVLWKYTKSSAETRLVELVKSMYADAQAQGVWLHLRNLLEWDSRGQEELATVYQEAEEAARAFDLELRLPLLMGADARRCEFVENGAAFISVLGDASPCPFLWHRYVCQMDGHKKYIRPWRFGRLQDAPLDAIWRSDAFVAFRKEVLEYTFPYCSNCSFVPCDDIVGESYPFEIDCAGHSAPCGHCLWCMGGLQCLL